jgi:CRISPR-associated protein Csd1
MIKGITGAQSSGAALVSFNAEAYESYGKKQGMNAPISEYAAFAYTTALNHLIVDRKHTQNLGDTTVVYWAKTAETQYADCYGLANFNPNSVSEGELATIFSNISAGKKANFADLPLDPQNEFNVLGLSPNAARLSVRFFYHNKFGAIMDNLKRYYDESNIVKPSYEKWNYLPLWVLLNETTNKNAKNVQVAPLLMGAVMRSILTGSRYPQALYENILLRVKADQDVEEKGKTTARKITWAKAAILKACLRRNYNNKEEATVSLNEESKDKAYVLGRLFAVLEHLQESANPGVNSTIKDRYFNSACTSPSLIFPVLLKLANHHLRKIEVEKGKQVYFEKHIGEIEDKLEMNEHPIPMHLGLEEQGKFILGYYHQVQKRFEKKEDK